MSLDVAATSEQSEESRPGSPDPRPHDEEDSAHSGAAELPLYHQQAWVQSQTHLQHDWVTLGTSAGDPHVRIAVQIEKSRALPGHIFGRVHRFGQGLPVESLDGAAAALAAYARRHPRLLRLTVSVFSLGNRDRVGEALAAHGFHRSPVPLSYRHTLVLDLQPELPAILAGVDKNLRRDLREVEKAHARVEALADLKFAERLGELESAAMRRSGGSFRRQNWPAVLQMSSEAPQMSRVAGIFMADTPSAPEHLVGFGWGCMHGSHGEYRAAGTTRIPGSRLSLSAPVLWDLIAWSKAQGATWFDMGGVTVSAPGEEAADPLAAISAFKRRFSKEVAEVGEDWVLEPQPLRLRAAGVLGQGAKVLAKVLRRGKADAS